MAASDISADKRRAFRIVLLAVGVIAGLALGEGLTRAAAILNERRNFVESELGLRKLVYSDEPNTPYVFGHQPNARVTFHKGADHFTVITNARGLRETRDYGELSSSVIFLGDSVVEGSSVENDETIDAVFERTTGVTALNFGLASSSTAQQYYWLTSKYDPRFHTRLVILGYTYEDLPLSDVLLRFQPEAGGWDVFRWLDGPPPSPPAPRNATERLKRFAGHSAFVSLIYHQFVPAPVPRDTETGSGTPAQRAVTERYLRKLDEFSRDIGARLVVVVIPTRKQVEAATPAPDRLQQVAIEILDAAHIPRIDLLGPMREWRAQRPDTRWFWDHAHPHKEGHRAIGEYLGETLPKMFPGQLPPAGAGR